MEPALPEDTAHPARRPAVGAAAAAGETRVMEGAGLAGRPRRPGGGELATGALLAFPTLSGCCRTFLVATSSPTHGRVRRRPFLQAGGWDTSPPGRSPSARSFARFLLDDSLCCHRLG